MNRLFIIRESGSHIALAIAGYSAIAICYSLLGIHLDGFRIILDRAVKILFAVSYDPALGIGGCVRGIPGDGLSQVGICFVKVAFLRPGKAPIVVGDRLRPYVNGMVEVLDRAVIVPIFCQ